MPHRLRLLFYRLMPYRTMELAKETYAMTGGVLAVIFLFTIIINIEDNPIYLDITLIL